MGRGFKRTVEDFTCENCGRTVTGNGYTNHCPDCLWSKHVDDSPGDRSMIEECGCLMEPIAIETKGGRFVIVHKCINCGIERINRTSPEDNEEEIVRIAHKGAKRGGRKTKR